MNNRAGQQQTLTADNYSHCFFRFRDRQAGISEIYDPDSELYRYNCYCVEQTVLKELYTLEFAFLDDALVHINDEFGNWEFCDFAPQKNECGSCQNNRQQ